MKTEDGGETWHERGVSCAGHCRYHKIWFLDDKHGYAAGEYNPEDQTYPTLVETLDGGETWRYTWEYLPENRLEDLWFYDRWLRDMAFSDEQTGWTVGTQGVFKTTDGGSRWLNQRAAISLNGLFFMNENTGWAVGENGTIIKTNNAGGDFEVESSPTSSPPEQERVLRLFHTFPNPFNAETTIRFSLPEAARIRITIYNMLGRKVTELLNAELTSGEHEILWNATEFASGIYFCTFSAGEFRQTVKLLLLK